MTQRSCVEALITLLTDRTQPTWVPGLKNAFDWLSAPDPITYTICPAVLVLDPEVVPEKRIAGPAILGLHESRWWLEAQVITFVGKDLGPAPLFRDLVDGVQAAMRRPRFAGLADTAETHVLWSGDNMRRQILPPRYVGDGLRRHHAVLRVEVVEERVA